MFNNILDDNQANEYESPHILPAHRQDMEAPFVFAEKNGEQGEREDVDHNKDARPEEVVRTQPIGQAGSGEEEASAMPLPENFQALLNRGVQFGHAKRYVHPSMFPFIASVRNDVHIIDVEKTEEYLKRAASFVQQKAADNRIILFVGTKAPLRNLVRSAAQEADMPYLVQSWAGGTLTNWKTISLRIERLRELREMKKSDEFAKYPKQEQSLMQQEMNKLEMQWAGIADLKRTPDVLIVTDMQHDHLAIKEARRIGVPVVGIADTNVNAAFATYAIPANDDSMASVGYILEELKNAIVEGKKQVTTKLPINGDTEDTQEYKSQIQMTNDK